MRENKIEPVLLLLFGGIVLFIVALFISEKCFPMDGQIFQVISGLLTGFSGAFMMRVKPRADGANMPDGTTSQVTSTTQTTVQEPKP